MVFLTRKIRFVCHDRHQSAPFLFSDEDSWCEFWRTLTHSPPKQIGWCEDRRVWKNSADGGKFSRKPVKLARSVQSDKIIYSYQWVKKIAPHHTGTTPRGHVLAVYGNAGMTWFGTGWQRRRWKHTSSIWSRLLG